MRSTSVPRLLICTLLVILAPLLQAADTTDLALLQGTWKIVSAEKGNRMLSPEEIKPLKLVIAKDQFTLLSEDHKLFDTKLILNSSKSPKHLHLTSEEENALGIYQLDGDQLKICWDNAGEQPTEFKGTNENASLINLKLTRQK